MVRHKPRYLLLALVVIGLVVFAQRQAPRIGADAYSQLRWRYIGPEGNRVSAVAGVPGNPLVLYAGSASCGIFKTTDGGLNWEPIFDSQPVSSIGDLALARVRLRPEYPFYPAPGPLDRISLPVTFSLPLSHRRFTLCPR